MRIAVISPFVDRRHGTERAVAELIEHLVWQCGDTVDLYAQSVADISTLDRVTANRDSSAAIHWHCIGRFSAPRIVQFPGWLWLNQRARQRNLRRARNAPDVTFSPGINALDADVILVHAVFHRLAELQSGRELAGLRGAHRRLYYLLLCALERRIYDDPRVTLAAVSQHTADQLANYFGRRDVAVIPNGVDSAHFSPAAIASRRSTARAEWCLPDENCVLLLVGNDWHNKGLKALLEAMSQLRELPLRLLVVGQDEQSPFQREVEKLGLFGLVDFFPPVDDVRTFYAAADALVAPSLEDSFNLPALEAMACGLPCIVSRSAGVSEWLTDGLDALLLRDPQSAGELAAAIRAVAADSRLRGRLAENAVATAAKLSWEEHTMKLRALMEMAAAKKRKDAGR